MKTCTLRVQAYLHAAFVIIYRSGYWIRPKSGAGLRDRAPFFMSKKRGGTTVGLYADAVKFLYIAGLCAGLRDHRIG